MRFIQDHCNNEECNKKHHAKGFCATHYTAFKKANGTYKQNNKLNLGELNFEYKNRTSWSLSVKKIFSDKCMICSWQEASCDTHHIIPHNEGGPNCLSNAIVLCPNHHKLADTGILTKDYLQQITDNKIKSI